MAKSVLLFSLLCGLFISSNTQNSWNTGGSYNQNQGGYGQGNYGSQNNFDFQGGYGGSHGRQYGSRENYGGSGFNRDSAEPFRITYEWYKLDYAWPDDMTKVQASMNRRFIPENNAISGIKVWRDRLFLTVPRWKEGVPATLVSVPTTANQNHASPRLEPFPNWQMQEIGNCSALQFVQNIEIDTEGRMWIIDAGRVNILDGGRDSICSPKLVIIDLNSVNFQNQYGGNFGGNIPGGQYGSGGYQGQNNPNYQGPNTPGYQGPGSNYPNQGHVGPQQGYPGQNQGYPGQNQGYPGQNQGYPGQNQGQYPGQQNQYPNQYSGNRPYDQNQYNRNQYGGGQFGYNNTGGNYNQYGGYPGQNNYYNSSYPNNPNYNQRYPNYPGGNQPNQPNYQGGYNSNPNPNYPNQGNYPGGFNNQNPPVYPTPFPNQNSINYNFLSNLGNVRVVRSFNFPSNVASQSNSYLKDIVLDNSNGWYAYITDQGDDPGIIVYSFREDRSWKVKDARSMRSDPDTSFISINNIDVDLRSRNIDGIALSPQYSYERTLYYSPLGSYNLYSVPTSVLKNPNLPSDISSSVRDLGRKQSITDGMIMDNRGTLYYGLLQLNAIARWDSKRDPIFESGQQIMSRDNNLLQWPDSFCFDDAGNLWVVTNRLQNYLTGRVNLEEPNYRILKGYVGSKSYLQPFDSSYTGDDRYNSIDSRNYYSGYRYNSATSISLHSFLCIAFTLLFFMR